ncbi:MAG: hypothetical protein N2C12_11240, partial [Planctomycetales bacterium]
MKDKGKLTCPNLRRTDHEWKLLVHLCRKGNGSASNAAAAHFGNQVQRQVCVATQTQPRIFAIAAPGNKLCNDI